jgi:hypothetical protein
MEAFANNCPQNLIELTIEEHAEAHKQLWLMHRNPQDEIAYMALSGQITQSEAAKEAQKIGASLGGKTWKGKKRGAFAEEHKAKLAAAKLGKKRPHFESTKEKIGKANQRPQVQVVCPHCSKSGGKSLMYRYHFENCRNKVIN